MWTILTPNSHYDREIYFKRRTDVKISLCRIVFHTMNFLILTIKTKSQRFNSYWFWFFSLIAQNVLHVIYTYNIIFHYFLYRISITSNQTFIGYRRIFIWLHRRYFLFAFVWQKINLLSWSNFHLSIIFGCNSDKQAHTFLWFRLTCLVDDDCIFNAIDFLFTKTATIFTES